MSAKRVPLVKVADDAVSLPEVWRSHEQLRHVVDDDLVRKEVYERDRILFDWKLDRLKDEILREIGSVQETLRTNQATTVANRNRRGAWVLGIVCAAIPGIISSGGVVTILIQHGGK